MAESTVLTIVPTWNNQVDIGDLLASFALEPEELERQTIVIVDNGSRDDTVAVSEKWLASLESLGLRRWAVERFPENRGIAAAYNEAFALHGGSSTHVWRLESDVVLLRGSLRRLLDCLDTNHRIGLAGSVGLRDVDREVLDHGARFVNWWTGAVSDRIVQEVTPCDITFGGSFVVRKDILERTGGFFARASFLASEFDLCARVREAGFSTVCVPTSRVHHKTARSSSRLDPRRFRELEAMEALRLLVRHNRFYRLPVLVGLALVRAIREVSKGENAELRGVARALGFSFLLTGGALPSSGTDWAKWLGAGEK